MFNPWSPSPDEVRQWVYSTETPWEDEPCEDWPMALAWAQHEKAYLELASDPSCPSHEYIVFILYYIVGYSVRRSTPEEITKGFISLGDVYQHPDIKLWQQRSFSLLNDPEKFDYQKWCAGGYLQKNGE